MTSCLTGCTLHGRVRPSLACRPHFVHARDEPLDAVIAGRRNDDTLAEFRDCGIGRITDILYVEGSFGKHEPRLTLNKHDAEFFKALMMGPSTQVDYLKNEADFSIHRNNSDAVQVSERLDRFGTTDDELAELDTDSLSSGAFFKLYRLHLGC